MTLILITTFALFSLSVNSYAEHQGRDNLQKVRFASESAMDIGKEYLRQEYETNKRFPENLNFKMLNDNIRCNVEYENKDVIVGEPVDNSIIKITAKASLKAANNIDYEKALVFKIKKLQDSDGNYINKLGEVVFYKEEGW